MSKWVIGEENGRNEIEDREGNALKGHNLNNPGWQPGAGVLPKSRPVV